MRGLTVFLLLLLLLLSTVSHDGLENNNIKYDTIIGIVLIYSNALEALASSGILEWRSEKDHQKPMIMPASDRLKKKRLNHRKRRRRRRR